MVKENISASVRPLPADMGMFPVGYDYIFDIQYHIVPYGLFRHGAVECHIRPFAFDDGQRPCLPVIDHYVRPVSLRAETEGCLAHHHVHRNLHFGVHVSYKPLAHTFFWSERHILLPQWVPYRVAAHAGKGNEKIPVKKIFEPLPKLLSLHPMAKGFADTDAQCRSIVEDVRRGVFSPVYLLMGDEPYYPDMVCNAIIANALDESERDFNQTVCYGMDVTVEDVITAARRYPMFAERQLVVVKEAQNLKRIEELAVYCVHPLESTVLVICMHGAAVDRRKAFYKAVCKAGIVVESSALRDYEMPRWIASFYASRGLDISPDAAALLAEFAGTDLSKIAVETDKMLHNLPEGTSAVSVGDIERNVGISRQYSVFELTKELSYRNAARALKVAAYYAASPKFSMPMAVSALFTHFYRILKYGALLMSVPRPSPSDKAKALPGVNPYFYKEYDSAVANYPLKKCMAVVALLREYDFKGKGGNAGEATPDRLFVELVARILN